MEKIDKAIEILQAFKEGKIIEVKLWNGYANIYAWQELDKTEKCLFNALSSKDADSIRIKAFNKPYEAYRTAEEFLKASKEHGPYIKLKSEDIYYCPYFVGKASIRLSPKIRNKAFIELYNEYIWQDGTPCGISVQ